jgi:hypothetical protein
MLDILLVIIVGAVVVVLVLLTLIVIGIKREPPTELTSQPPSATTAWVRRFLGLYVHKPGQASVGHDQTPHLAARERPGSSEGPAK